MRLRCRARCRDDSSLDRRGQLECEEPDGLHITGYLRQHADTGPPDEAGSVLLSPGPHFLSSHLHWLVSREHKMFARLGGPRCPRMSPRHPGRAPVSGGFRRVSRSLQVSGCGDGCRRSSPVSGC
ncbi:unnamed protein product [Lota lota]